MHTPRHTYITIHRYIQQTARVKCTNRLVLYLIIDICIHIYIYIYQLSYHNIPSLESKLASSHYTILPYFTKIDSNTRHFDPQHTGTCLIPQLSSMLAHRDQYPPACLHIKHRQLAIGPKQRYLTAANCTA